MIKLVVCDLDGTLLPYGEENIDNNTIKKIIALINDGVYFAVSSGRVYAELRNLLSEFADRIYFISSDGALANFGDRIIFHKPFSADALNFAINSCKNSHLRLFGKDTVWTYNPSGDFAGDIKILKPFEIKDSVYKIISYGSPILNFEGTYSRIHYSDGALSEYVPPYANKGVALGALQRHLGISMFETVAIGDSVNDIPMMKNAKYRVAVGDKLTRLHSECNIFTDNVDKILEKVWLKTL